MPNLNDITLLINQALVADEFASRRFQNAKFNAIAERIKITGEETERWEVAVIDNDGEAQTVCIDDTYAMQVYHRIDSLEYPIVPENDYGKPGHTMTEVANMRMIFLGDRGRLTVRPENVVAAAVVDFPKEFLPAEITPLQLNSCMIDIGTTELDPYMVWDREFTGSAMELDTNTILCSISYRITSTFNKSCFKLCN